MSRCNRHRARIKTQFFSLFHPQLFYCSCNEFKYPYIIIACCNRNVHRFFFVVSIHAGTQHSFLFSFPLSPFLTLFTIQSFLSKLSNHSDFAQIMFDKWNFPEDLSTLITYCSSNSICFVFLPQTHFSVVIIFKEEEEMFQLKPELISHGRMYLLGDSPQIDLSIKQSTINVSKFVN